MRKPRKGPLIVRWRCILLGNRRLKNAFANIIILAIISGKTLALDRLPEQQIRRGRFSVQDALQSSFDALAALFPRKLPR